MKESRQPVRVEDLWPVGALPESMKAGRVLPHGTRIAGHHHDYAHLAYPATGVLTISAAGGTWVAPANRAAWIPAGVEHYNEVFGSTDARMLVVPGAKAVGLPTQPAVLVVSPLMRELLLTLTGPRELDPGVRDRLLQVAVDELVGAPELPLHLPEPHDDRLRAVTDLLHADPADTRTLAELGHVVGASERTLSRLFHEELKMSFRQWRIQLRIHHALVLLAAGRSITETSLACGWSNPSTFIGTFASVLGQTPGRYQADLSDRRTRQDDHTTQ
jgi:AraC-like DNA-binding protein/quercetin dioxygenase-like cupin family protein